VGVTAPTPPTDAQRQIGEYLGVPLNPDTGQPFPSASQAQLELAEELFARLIDGLDGVGELSREELRDALVEVAVRQHGRTLRACLGDLRSQADGFDEDARTLAASAVSEGPVVDSARLGSASRLAAGAATLRTVHLRADRA
jgi:hypothetical protein